MCFLDESLPYHPNAMELIAYNEAQEILYAETYYSVGGGFIVSQRQLTHTLKPTTLRFHIHFTVRLNF